jgi:hypothetical protein
MKRNFKLHEFIRSNPGLNFVAVVTVVVVVVVVMEKKPYIKSCFKFVKKKLLEKIEIFGIM